MRSLLLLTTVLALSACAEAEPPAGSADAPRAAAPMGPPLATVAPRPAAAPAAADAFEALGTEPFWAVSIGRDWISFSGLDRPLRSWPNPGVRWQGKRRTWAAEGPAGAIRVRLDPAECSDGMSDRVYPYEVEVVLGEEVLKGCARKAEA